MGRFVDLEIWRVGDFGRACVGRRLLVIAAICSLSSLDAQSARPLQPGEYITDEGWDTLRITRDRNGKLLFKLAAAGVNGHSCDLDGEIQHGRATLATTDDAHGCGVEFTSTNEGIDVRGDREACRSFCGARAGFEAVYL